MSMRYLPILVAVVLLILPGICQGSGTAFQYSVEPVPDDVRASMIPATWREGCPVPIEELVYMRLNHWGMDGKVHDGAIIVHRIVAQDVADIFAELFQARFPLESVRIIEEFNGDDMASMQADNTSGFNCRKIAGSKKLSWHSYGVAIDINPLLNPYVKGDYVSPPEGAPHAGANERWAANLPGYVLEGNICHKAFVDRGWEWGGAWDTRQDYQHFEKPSAVKDP